ncbi:MAG: hypothetical protein DWP97_09755 [Calditrichaeota bacterium]|nr:MAG: hypothetical protein DWP97_09755 [Calditrichota bacterium]
MKAKVFNSLLGLLYIAAIGAIIYLAVYGYEYYMTPIIERPHAELHTSLKPGGIFGHGYGVIGSAFILLLFLYSARKRFLLGLRFGNIRKWLNVHIFFGIIGPLLITLHTAGKLHGLVSISYFSMLAVMFSGIIGRYIYIQIPRDEEGQELALGQLDQKHEELSNMLIENYDISKKSIDRINRMIEPKFSHDSKGIFALFVIITDDIQRPFRFWKLKRYITKTYPAFPPKAIRRIMHLSKTKSLMLRRRKFLGAVTNVFHLWHVIHKPFAWIMIIIMLIHVTITVLMGYKWVF